MKNKSLSAVIGVILMVAITVAIVAVVYIYVSALTTDDVEDVEYIYKTGLLRGFYEENGDPIILGDEELQVYGVDENYLVHFIGQNITLVLEPYEGWNDYYDYIYVGAYLN